jgi:hypothetical protein
MDLKTIINDKKELEARVGELTKAFEDKHGVESIESLSIRRWNGSNDCSGRIVSIQIYLDFDSLGNAS